MSEKTILLLGADSCKTLPLAFSLRKKGYRVVGLFQSRLNYGYSCRYIQKRLVFRDLYDIARSEPFLQSIFETYRFDAVIPLEDVCAELVSRMGLPGFPSLSVFQVGFDKKSLMRLCERKAYPHPKTYFPEDGLPDDLHFPLIVKPDITSGARGMAVVYDREELERVSAQTFAEFGPYHLQEFIRPGGRQIEVQLFVDKEGSLVQSSVIEKYRWYPVQGGSSCCNVSAAHSAVVNVCHRILKDLQWVGFADFDTIENPDTGELMVLELNPRLPACIKTAFVSGVDWGDILAAEYMGESHACYQEKGGEWLRYLGFEILWFLHSPDRFRTKPSWFRFFGKHIHYQDMGMGFDPLPWFTGTLGNIVKILNPEFRRKKSGME